MTVPRGRWFPFVTGRPSIRHAIRVALVTLSVVIGVAILFRSHGALISAQADGKVTHTVNGNTETWRIDEPNVKQKVTPYPQIKFRPGDKVTIQASGCVQTGGTGNTWKRYVNPSGPDADRPTTDCFGFPALLADAPRPACLPIRNASSRTSGRISP